MKEKDNHIPEKKSSRSPKKSQEGKIRLTASNKPTITFNGVTYDGKIKRSESEISI